jgi:hypothetical protein
MIQARSASIFSSGLLWSLLRLVWWRWCLCRRQQLALGSCFSSQVSQLLLIANSIGALMLGGGAIVYRADFLATMLIVKGVLCLAAIIARPSLLMTLAVLAASACLGAHTGYSHASYSLAIS